MELGVSSTGRRYAKNTPSPANLRDRVIRNCLSALKTKRKVLFDQRRAGDGVHDDIMKAFVSEMYHATRRQDYAAGLHMEEDVEQSELLSQIADAIEFELEKQRENDASMLEFLESEEFAHISLYEQGDDVVICPVCRSSILSIREDTRQGVCTCGVVLDLQGLTTLVDSNQHSNVAAALKARLADVFERHQALCTEYSQLMRDGAYQGYYCSADSMDASGAHSNGQGNDNLSGRLELEFRVQGGHLIARCPECSYYEQVS